MNSGLRQKVLFIFLVIVLALGVLWAKQTYDQSRLRLQTVSKETAACREAVASIRQFRGASTPTDADMPEEQLYQCLHESARFAGVEDGEVIRSINPQPARPMRGSSLQQKDVNLELQGMTMEQLVRFLQHLHATHPQLQVSAMTIHDPKGLGLGSLWNVEPLVLSYQIQPSSTSNTFAASNP